ncbi:MAG: transcriptional repressor NrdR [Deltaproteobacteria bacterium]|nr:transcriptional repressor NrdR [Deltaproteobacteria bacterium]MBI4224354.1 transcriptional repressor NrdR [Deltaproteobacteria bacterium]
MNCPFCHHTESKVIDSRDSAEGEIIRRRRECEKCGERFTTYERLEQVYPAVIKKDARRENFDPKKILEGVRKACEKRPVPIATLEDLVHKASVWVQEQETEEIESKKIGLKVMELLHDLDEVAYVRFASVYRSFEDLGEFMKELKDLLGKQKSG